MFNASATITGTRLELGAAAARGLSLALSVCVQGGSRIDNGSGTPPMQTDERAYSVLIRRSDWPDHKGPQPGDVLSGMSDYPDMRVNAVTGDPDRWRLRCIAKGMV